VTIRHALVLATVALGTAVLSIAFFLRDGKPPARGDLFRGSEPPSDIKLPHFKLRSYTGVPIDSMALQQKVVLVTFLESKCETACPFIAGQIGRTMRRLEDAERSNVIALGISTHPTDDTPTRVRAFLRRERADGQLQYLIGSERELRRVWTAFRILPAFDSGDANTHSAPVRVYREGTWVATLHTGADLTADNLLHDVRVALTKDA
jgi:cytochrome oxidase Cu insertion factor (SCO1/SenC/PrrC family)